MAGVIKREILGESVEFTIDNEGRFSAEIGGDDGGAREGESIRSATLAEAVETATKIIKRRQTQQNKAVDVTVVDISLRDPKTSFYGGDYVRGDELIDFSLRGYTPRTSSLLVSTKDGKKTKLEKHTFGDNVLRKLDGKERDQYRELIALKRKVEAELAEFIKSKRLDWREHFNVDPKER